MYDEDARDAQDDRIDKIVCADEHSTLEDGRDKYYPYLAKTLKLPCDVTGIEDFQWEEYYVMGRGDPREYKKLCKNQPSYKDIFELLSIEMGVDSEWMMFPGEDLAAHVRRKSDGKEFCLGLSEVEAVDKKSDTYQLLNDYSVWFVNNR